MYVENLKSASILSHSLQGSNIDIVSWIKQLFKASTTVYFGIDCKQDPLECMANGQDSKGEGLWCWGWKRLSRSDSSYIQCNYRYFITLFTSALADLEWLTDKMRERLTWSCSELSLCFLKLRVGWHEAKMMTLHWLNWRQQLSLFNTV